jgi:hypothetical protein
MPNEIRHIANCKRGDKRPSPTTGTTPKMRNRQIAKACLSGTNAAMTTRATTNFSAKNDGL